MKDIVRLVVVLGLICLASGATLALVYDVTKKPIEMQVLKNVEGPALEAVLTDKDNNPIEENFKVPAGKDAKGRDVEKTIFPAKKGGKLVAVALASQGKGFDGNIGVMVGIDTEGKLTGIAIMKHSETPGIGSRITEATFTNQFQGKPLDSPTAVDGVSGATYSTKGVFAAVNKAVDFYKNNKDQILAQAGQ